MKNTPRWGGPTRVLAVRLSPRLSAAVSSLVQQNETRNQSEIVRILIERGIKSLVKEGRGGQPV